jgi:hypothetical protein
VNWFEGTPTTNRAGEQHQTTKVRTWCDTTSGFSGAPLDAVKVASACLMLADHVNCAFFGHVANFMWYLGRPVFPLFVFAMVCNLIRGTDAREYVGKLILLELLLSATRRRHRATRHIRVAPVADVEQSRNVLKALVSLTTPRSRRRVLYFGVWVCRSRRESRQYQASGATSNSVR